MTRFLERFDLPNLRVVCARAEEWGIRSRFDVVTGRAVAPLAIQLELSAPLLKEGGMLLAMRTPQEREAAEKAPHPSLGLQLETLTERRLAGTDVTRLFPVWRKTGRTSAHLPRPWAEMKRKPL